MKQKPHFVWLKLLKKLGVYVYHKMKKRKGITATVTPYLRSYFSAYVRGGDVQIGVCYPTNILKHLGLRRMCRNSFHGRFKVFFIKFASGQVEVVVMAGDCDAAAAQVRVQDFVAGFSIVIEQPFVEGYWFLGWVNAGFANINCSKTNPR